MPRDRLEPVARQVARREVVAEHGVERVDQLAPGRDQPHAAAGVARADRHAAAGPALAQPGPADPAERERHAEQPRAPIEERQIEAVQVVVLDHVRIGRADLRDQTRDQRGLVIALEHLDGPIGVPHGDQEDPIALRIEAGGLQIELHPAQLVERQVPEVGAPRRDQVLLLGRQHQHRVVAEVAQVGDGVAEPPARGAEDRARQRRHVVGAHEVAQRSRAGELPRGQLAWQVVEPVEQHPRPEPHVVADQRAVHSPPHRDRAVAVRPHRDDARGRVPPLEPLVFDRAHHGPPIPPQTRRSLQSPASSGRLRSNACIVA